ncbi:MAG: hypothetical protein AABY40_04505 [Nanoarchaeota archaeon]
MQKKRTLLLFVILFALLCGHSVFAFFHDEEVITAKTGISDAAAESMKQYQINQLFKAFDSRDATTAVQILSDNPEFFQLDGVTEAFNNAITEKPVETAEALNSDNGVILLAENQEVQDAYAEQASKDVQVLNVAPKAKATLFKEKHGVIMENDQVEVTDYDDIDGLIETEIKYIEKPGDEFYDESYASNPYFTDRSLITADSEKYDQGEIKIGYYGGVIFEPNPELDKLDVPETDILTIAIPEGESLIYVSDKDTVMMDEAGNRIYTDTPPLKGTVRIDQGHLVVWKKPATIDDVLITPSSFKEKIDIYFDGQSHEGNYVSMDHQKLMIKFGRGDSIATDPSEPSGSSSYSVKFESGNPYLKVSEPGDPDLKVGNVVIEPRPNTEVTVEHRLDKIPLVTVQGEINLDNGYQTFYNSKGGTFYQKFSSNVDPVKESAPLALHIVDEKRNNVLGTESEKLKIIFDKYHNYIVLPEGEAEEKFEVKRSWVIYDYWKGRIEEISGTKITAYQNLPLLANHLSRLPPEVKDSIGDIEVLPRKLMDAECGKKAAACANSKDRRISVLPGVDYTTFYHEAVHTQTHLEEQGTYPKYKKFARVSLELQGKYGEDFETKATAEELETYRDLYHTQDEEKRSSLSIRAEWEAVAGPVYTHRRIEEEANTAGFSEITEGHVDGCLSRYGCTDYYEDVAEFAAHSATKPPAFFAPLLIPPGEAGHNPEKYDPRYKQKLDMLYISGKITQENYNSIIQATQAEIEKAKSKEDSLKKSAASALEK